MLIQNSCQTWFEGAWKLCEKQTIDTKKFICKCKTSEETVVIKYGKLSNLPSSMPHENDKEVTEVMELKSTVIPPVASQRTTSMDANKINENSQTTVNPEIPAVSEDSNHQNNSNTSTDNSSGSSNGVNDSSMSEAQKETEENSELEGNKPIKLGAVTILPTGSKTTPKSTKKPSTAKPTASTKNIKSVTPTSSQKPLKITAKTTIKSNTTTSLKPSAASNSTMPSITTTPVVPSLTTATNINANATDGKIANSKLPMCALVNNF